MSACELGTGSGKALDCSVNGQWRFHDLTSVGLGLDDRRRTTALAQENKRRRGRKVDLGDREQAFIAENLFMIL